MHSFIAFITTLVNIDWALGVHHHAWTCGLYQDESAFLPVLSGSQETGRMRHPLSSCSRTGEVTEGIRPDEICRWKAVRHFQMYSWARCWAGITISTPGESLNEDSPEILFQWGKFRAPWDTPAHKPRMTTITRRGLGWGLNLEGDHDKGFKGGFELCLEGWVKFG